MPRIRYLQPKLIDEVRDTINVARAERGEELIDEVRDTINVARAERGEEPIDNWGRTPDRKRAYKLLRAGGGSAPPR